MHSSFSRYPILRIPRPNKAIIRHLIGFLNVLTFMQCIGSNSLLSSLNLGLSFIKGYSMPVLGIKVGGCLFCNRFYWMLEALDYEP